MIDKLVETGHIPSFCTACYVKGRTGEHFMEFSVPGFIKNICTPNALLTFAEYLEDYASAGSKIKGYELVNRQLDTIENAEIKEKCAARIEKIKNGERNLLF